MAEHYPINPTPGQEGWFQDPQNPRYARFWDGTEWTSHITIKELPPKGDPPAFRPDQAPGPVSERRLPPSSLGQIALPGQPPINPRGGNGIFMVLLRKIFGDHRDPKQRL